MLLFWRFLKIVNSTKVLVPISLHTSDKIFLNSCLRKCDVPSFHYRSVTTTAVLRSSTERIRNHLYRKRLPDEAHSIEHSNTKNYSHTSSEELLERLVTLVSSDIHQKNRVYKNTFLKVLKKVNEMNFSSKKQGLLLIRCCTEMMADEAPSVRMELAEQVWNTLKPHTQFTVDHYNELLRVYIANNRTLTARSFIKQMEPVVPNTTTYELILTALGEAGDLNQTTEVIANMKAQNMAATEGVFNSLIICQGKNSNLQNISEVLTMMTSLMLERSVNTYTAIARALIWNKKNQQMLEEMKNACNNGIKFGETHIMDIVKTLAAVGNYEPIPMVLNFLPKEILKSPSISPYMQSVSTQLVFQNHPIAALEIYKCLPLPSFGPKDDQGLHGRSLVRDCVKASVPSSIISLITQELMASGRNPIALQNASEAALQLGKIPLALDLFTRMKQLGLPLRAHYFWPVLLHSSRTYGEKGIMNSLQTMVSMEVMPDYETIMTYVLPYVSFTSPQNLMKKFQETSLSVGIVLTPMMETLLNMGQVRAASEICELFHGKVDAEKILKPLLKGYLTSMDVKSTVYILQDVTDRATEKNKDWVGRFLCIFMQHSKVKQDMTDFLSIIKMIQEIPLTISTSSADYCLSRLPELLGLQQGEEIRTILVNITDDKLVDEGDMFTHQIPHPKNMNEESLKAHLIELEAKGMNTRGVLRKLLQEYCRVGNLAAARDIISKCQKEGVFLSAGMKASIFDLHVKLGEIDLAEVVLADLNKSFPNFVLDEFKVVDFATLMAYRGKVSRAFDLISEQSKKRHIVGGRHISLNCWRLLDAIAAQSSPADTRRMFELLTSLRYCAPTNVLLGPLVRVYLKEYLYYTELFRYESVALLIHSNKIAEAVNEFVRIANEYNKTPLKHELLCKILRDMSDGRSEENFIINEKSNGRLNKMAQTVLNVDRKIHGSGDVQLTVIAALADVGYKKTLRKTLLDPNVNFHPDALLRRCERFADEGKVAPLEAVAECTRGIRHFDVKEIYELILDVHQREDACEKALELWTRMQEADIIPSQKFIRNFCAFCEANNKPIPYELTLLRDKDTKKVPQEKNQEKVINT